jgi:hypothetical protein
MGGRKRAARSVDASSLVGAGQKRLMAAEIATAKATAA